MKRVISVFVALIAAFVLGGCSTEVDTEKNILSYAKEHYGEAEHIRTESGEDSRTCYFRDSEYGFEYRVSSGIQDIGMDGATFWQQESKGGNFEEVYYSFMQQQCGIEGGVVAADGTQIEPHDFVYNGISIDINAAQGGVEAACKHAEKLRDDLKALDTRGYWENISCTVFDENGARYLTYDSLHESPLTPEDEDVIFYTEMAQMKHSEAEFVRTETGLFSETGLTADDLPNILGTEKPTSGSVVTYYYFEAEGKEFFLADFNAYEDGEYQRFFWYNNFSEVFPDE